MGLESATYIDDLVITNPTGSDDRSTADDHLRLIKSVLKTSFPTINGAVTAALSEINKLDGLTASQSELNLLTGRSLASNDDVIDNFEAGILALFQQSAAPTGWTKQTTHDNKALRVVSTTASSGGSRSFTSLFGVTAVDSHILVEAEIPSHDHGASGTHTHGLGATVTPGGGAAWTVAATTSSGNFTAPGGDHTHASFGGSSGHTHGLNMDVQYVDVIIASKD